MHFCDEFTRRGVKAQVEVTIKSMPGDRRADVAIWSPTEQLYVLEVQHTTIGLEEIAARGASYAREGIAQLWLPIIPQAVLSAAEPHVEGLFVKKYPARPYERWIHGLHSGKGMWFYDPQQKCLWRGKLEPYKMYVDETTYYSEG